MTSHQQQQQQQQQQQLQQFERLLSDSFLIKADFERCRSKFSEASRLLYINSSCWSCITNAIARIQLSNNTNDDAAKPRMCKIWYYLIIIFGCLEAFDKAKKSLPDEVPAVLRDVSLNVLGHFNSNSWLCNNAAPLFLDYLILVLHFDCYTAARRSMFWRRTELGEKARDWALSRRSESHRGVMFEIKCDIALWFLTGQDSSVVLPTVMNNSILLVRDKAVILRNNNNTPLHIDRLCSFLEQMNQPQNVILVQLTRAKLVHHQDTRRNNICVLTFDVETENHQWERCQYQLRTAIEHEYVASHLHIWGQGVTARIDAIATVDAADTRASLLNHFKTSSAPDDEYDDDDIPPEKNLWDNLNNNAVIDNNAVIIRRQHDLRTTIDAEFVEYYFTHIFVKPTTANNNSNTHSNTADISNLRRPDHLDVDISYLLHSLNEETEIVEESLELVKMYPERFIHHLFPKIFRRAMVKFVDFIRQCVFPKYFYSPSETYTLIMDSDDDDPSQVRQLDQLGCYLHINKDVEHRQFRSLVDRVLSLFAHQCSDTSIIAEIYKAAMSIVNCPFIRVVPSQITSDNEESSFDEISRGYELLNGKIVNLKCQVVAVKSPAAESEYAGDWIDFACSGCNCSCKITSRVTLTEKLFPSPADRSRVCPNCQSMMKQTTKQSSSKTTFFYRNQRHRVLEVTAPSSFVSSDHPHLISNNNKSRHHQKMDLYVEGALVDKFPLQTDISNRKIIISIRAIVLFNISDNNNNEIIPRLYLIKLKEMESLEELNNNNNAVCPSSLVMAYFLRKCNTGPASRSYVDARTFESEQLLRLPPTSNNNNNNNNDKNSGKEAARLKLYQTRVLDLIEAVMGKEHSEGRHMIKKLFDGQEQEHNDDSSYLVSHFWRSVLISSVAPELFGNSIAKLVVLLSCIGGLQYNFDLGGLAEPSTASSSSFLLSQNNNSSSSSFFHHTSNQSMMHNNNNNNNNNSTRRDDESLLMMTNRASYSYSEQLGELQRKYSGKEFSDSHRFLARPQIHIMFIGDSASGKTKLLEWAEKLAFQSEYNDASSMTKAGMLGSAGKQQRDPTTVQPKTTVSNRKFHPPVDGADRGARQNAQENHDDNNNNNSKSSIIDHSTLGRCSPGLCVIDEINARGSNAFLSSLLDPLESQNVTIAKADTSAEARVDFGLVCALRPIYSTVAAKTNTTQQRSNDNNLFLHKYETGIADDNKSKLPFLDRIDVICPLVSDMHSENTGHIRRAAHLVLNNRRSVMDSYHLAMHDVRNNNNNNNQQQNNDNSMLTDEDRNNFRLQRELSKYISSNNNNHVAFSPPELRSLLHQCQLRCRQRPTDWWCGQSHYERVTKIMESRQDKHLKHIINCDLELDKGALQLFGRYIGLRRYVYDNGNTKCKFADLEDTLCSDVSGLTGDRFKNALHRLSIASASLVGRERFTTQEDVAMAILTLEQSSRGVKLTLWKKWEARNNNNNNDDDDANHQNMNSFLSDDMKEKFRKADDKYEFLDENKDNLSLAQKLRLSVEATRMTSVLEENSNNNNKSCFCLIDYWFGSAVVGPKYTLEKLKAQHLLLEEISNTVHFDFEETEKEKRSELEADTDLSSWGVVTSKMMRDERMKAVFDRNEAEDQKKDECNVSDRILLNCEFK